MKRLADEFKRGMIGPASIKLAVCLGLMLAVIVIFFCERANAATLHLGPSIAWDDGTFTDERVLTLAVRGQDYEFAVSRYDGEAIRDGRYVIPDMWHFSLTRDFNWRGAFFGIGPGYVTEKSRRGGCNWTFAPKLGYRWDRLTLTWRHFSNGGFCEVNKGFDYVGLDWRF